MRISNKLVCTTILVILGFILQPAFGQAVGDEQRAALAQLGIYPYPSEDEVQGSAFSSEGFVVEPLSADDINEDFSNIEDLDWLAPIANEHQVVLVGENHYYQYTQHLRNRILFALNTVDTYPYLILERQYSSTPFLNYYLSLEDEQEAKRFEQEIHNFFLDESDSQLFQHLRRWNLTHPNKKIQVGCSDIEHDYALVFRHILPAYFSELKRTSLTAKEKWPVNVWRLSDVLRQLEEIFDKRTIATREALNQAFQPLDQFVAFAKERRIVGKSPFLTTQYIENVIDNLKSTYLAKTQNFTRYRQQAIIRNLTDPRFLGNDFKTGKVMIHAGGYHTPTHVPYSDGENFLREGSYLTYEFEPTKGQTYSLFIEGLAFFSVSDLERVNIETCQGAAYRYLVTHIHQALKHRLLSSTNAYIIEDPEERWEGLDDFMKLIFQMAYQHDHQPMLFRLFPWERLIEQAKALSAEQTEEFLARQAWLQRHDLNIVVPMSPMVLQKTDAPLVELKISNN